jgi:hypothetical protein
MDKQKRETLTKWGTELIAAAGPLEVRDSGGGVEIAYKGEPDVIPVEAAGVTIESKQHMQMILAATMFDRGYKLIQAASLLMQSAKLTKE